MNTFSFTGNLGQDCRTGNIPSGDAVCNFTVAAKAGYGDKGQTLWIDCALWGKRAEGKLCDYLVKGCQVAVSGELGTREHDGKTYLTCRVNSLDLIGGKSEAPSASSNAAPKANNAPAQDFSPADFDDDIPF